MANERHVSVQQAGTRMGMSGARVLDLIESGELSGVRDGNRWLVESGSVESWIRTHRRVTRHLKDVVLVHRSATESLISAIDLPYYSESTIESRLSLPPGTVGRWLTSEVPATEVDRVERLLANESALDETRQLVAQLIGRGEDEAWSIVEAAGRQWIDVTGANGIVANLDVMRVRVVVEDGLVTQAWAG